MKMHMPILSTIEKGAQNGVKAAAGEVLKLARQLAPEDDGTLRKSGKVVVDQLDATVKFTAPHAWLQHERMDYEHESGQAKYLEAAVEATDVGRYIADSVKAVIRG